MLNCRDFLKEEKGQGMAEYSLIVSILVIGLIGAFKLSVAGSVVSKMVEVYNTYLP